MTKNINEDFKKKGLLAILGIGFDPGVSNIYSAYARDYIFDQIDTIDILDCNHREDLGQTLNRYDAS
jgi:saccharopine dehydrogenase-like NADP-dependent oxidoreductase